MDVLKIKINISKASLGKTISQTAWIQIKPDVSQAESGSRLFAKAMIHSCIFVATSRERLIFPELYSVKNTWQNNFIKSYEICLNNVKSGSTLIFNIGYFLPHCFK